MCRPADLVLLYALLSMPATCAAIDAEALRCVPAVAGHFEVPPVVLDLVLTLEGGRVGSATRNTNGSLDLGPAQINTQHLATLQRLGINRETVRSDPCMNVAVAAWHLRRDYDALPARMATSDRWASALLSYHSPTPRHRADYRRKAIAALQRSQRPRKGK